MQVHETNVLIVDDEARILSALCRTLRREAYDLVTAETPIAGLRNADSIRASSSTIKTVGVQLASSLESDTFLQSLFRIKHIVQDLRDFSHNDTGELVLVDVNQCLESTVRIVWPMMKHMIELEHDYGDLPNVYGYPMQLKQVFMNLLVNAYTFGEPPTI